jgi:hypothetical protein
MAQTIRVSLPGFNVLTDIDPDHFALYADEDWVLIKEFSRGSISVATFDSESITHNLGYVPFWSVYAGGVWVWGWNIYGDYRASSNTTTLTLNNLTGSSAVFKYYIFYDQQV